MGLRLDKNLDPVDLGQQQTIRQLNNPGPVLLLGAPGVGKGTQAEILAKLWGVPKISTGDILRANAASGTRLGLHASKIMRSGGLVPDQIMTEMLADRLRLSDTAGGFILDGFPRTVGQAQWLDNHIGVHRNGDAVGIINLYIDYERIVQRVAYRRVCPLCKSVYNLVLAPPKQADRCDKDNSELEQRSDDRIEVLQARLDVFKRDTEPLLQYYRKDRMVIDVDAGQSLSLVTRDIVSGLKAFRSARPDRDLCPRLIHLFASDGRCRAVDN